MLCLAMRRELSRFREEVYANPQVVMDKKITRLRQANFKMEYKQRKQVRGKASVKGCAQCVHSRPAGGSQDSDVAAEGRQDAHMHASCAPTCAHTRTRARGRRTVGARPLQPPWRPLMRPP